MDGGVGGAGGLLRKKVQERLFGHALWLDGCNGAPWSTSINHRHVHLETLVQL